MNIASIKKYWVFFAVLIIISMGMYVRMQDYRWPYLRNIDSYFFYRHMGELVEKGTLPEIDTLMEAPVGSQRKSGQYFYQYIGAYSFMAYRFFDHSAQLDKFLIWFPALLATLMSIPMYFIGKLLYDRRAGVLAAFFVIFDMSIMSRTLAGDPDSDGVVLLVPLIVMAFFLFTYKHIMKKNAFDKMAAIYSTLTGLSLVIWGFTWSGHWYLIWLITGFIMIMLGVAYVKHRRNIQEFFKTAKPLAIFYALSIMIYFAITVPYYGMGHISSTFLGPTSFKSIKSEETGSPFPNVQVSVAEMQSPGDAREVIQRTSAINFSQSPLVMLMSPFFLMLYALIYLFYSYYKRREHLDTAILLAIWFLGPFVATLTAVRFSILFSAPLALGSAIILAKLLRIATGDDKKLED